MAAGTLYSGFADRAASRYEANVADRNAAMEGDAARRSIEQGRIETRQLYRDISRTKGQQAASMAANGIDLGFGSALRTQEDTAMLAAEDAALLNDSIYERTMGFDVRGSNERARARAARAKGSAALVGSFFKAGSILAGGIQQNAADNAPRAPSATSPTLMGGSVSNRSLRDRLGL